MADLEDVTLDGRPLQSLRVADLKAALEERGLSKSGQKNALIKRLKGALMLENLQRTSTAHVGLQPNSQIGEEMSQNSFIKQYLAKQQELLRQRLEREAREAYETNDQEDHNDINNSTCPPQAQDASPALTDHFKPPGPSSGHAMPGLSHRHQEVAMSRPPTSGSVALDRSDAAADSDEDDSEDGEEDDDDDDDWDTKVQGRLPRQPVRAPMVRERSAAPCQPQQQHIPSLLSPQLRQPTPPPSPPPELSFPLPDTPKQSPPSPDEAPAGRSPSSSSSGSSSSGSRSSSPEPHDGHAERKPGPLTLLARKMESEGAFSGAEWHCRDASRQDNCSSSDGLVSPVLHLSTASHAPVNLGSSKGHAQVPVTMLKATTERDAELEREKALELRRQEQQRKLEQERAMEEERVRAEKQRALEKEQFEREQALEREKALQMKRELALEREKRERELALAKEREEKERALELERKRALERELALRREQEEQERREREERARAEALERERALEAERIERERIEKEQALEQERLEQERLEKEAALERERQEKERKERERARELERIAREEALEKERIAQEKALEKERIEREKALEQERIERERIEREKALEQERIERERIEREKALEQERIERERIEREKALEQERIERERIEREKALEQERIERERIEREKALEQERIEQERIEREKALEQERIERERIEREKALEQERIEQERIERQKALEQERIEQERIEREKALEQERIERERIEQEKALEQERIERERALEQERIERERIEREKTLEKARIEREKALEQERIEREKALEQEKIEQEKLLEQKKIAQQKALEQERIEQEKLFERERIEREKVLEQERIAQEKLLEQEKIAQEKARELERIEQERIEHKKALEQERIEQEKAEREATLERERLEKVEERRLALQKAQERQALEEERKAKDTAMDLEKKRLAEQNSLERKLNTANEKAVAEEEHFPPTREIGFVPLPTPTPLSTGTSTNVSTEADKQEGEVHGPVTCESQAEESNKSPPSSFKKFRFTRNTALQPHAASRIIKRPRTFSDTPQHAPAELDSNAESQPHKEQSADLDVAGRGQSKIVEAEESILKGDSNLISENKEDHEKSASIETVVDIKGSPSRPMSPSGRGRDVKKTEKKDTRRSSSNDSSSSESDSSSSHSTGSSSSTEKKPYLSRPSRDDSPLQVIKVSKEQDNLSPIQMEISSEINKGVVDKLNEAPIQDDSQRRRKSSSDEDEKPENSRRESAVSEPEKGTEGNNETPKAFSTRKISLSSSKSSPGSTENDHELGSAGGRKRRWGSSTAVTAKKPSISITTDSLKSLIPDIKPALNQEAVMDLHPEDPVLSETEDEDKDHAEQDLPICRTVTQIVNVENQENGQKEAKRRRDESEEEDMQDEKETKTSNEGPTYLQAIEAPSPLHTRHEEEINTVTPSDILIRRSVSQQKIGVSITIDDPVRTARQPSPPRGEVSNIVHVCNLVRPFTLGQLKELLSRTGTLVEDGFWIDKIKSHCYVTYSSSEEAVATRAALHGVKWPQSNPKVLRVDFCQQDELDFHKGLGSGERPGVGLHSQGLPSLLPERDQWAEREREMGRRERARADREWDRDKVREFGKTPEDKEAGSRRSRSRERRRKEREKSKEKKTDKKEKPEDPPAKLLDDLFRKTKAVPCIYWLPLTEEQYLQRETARLERRKEREKQRKKDEEEAELKKKEEENKERMRAAAGLTVDRSETEKDKIRDRDRARDRGRDREADKRREGYRRPGGYIPPSGRRSRSRSDPRERRR